MVGFDLISFIPGVKLSEGKVVGAGTVVTKSYSIVGGMPARKIGERV